MKTIIASGTPYEIGHIHGTQAEPEITRGLKFYESLFHQATGLDWAGIQNEAKKFAPIIEANWPRYYEEMKGIADGSKKDFLDIIALNVRSEIRYGLEKPNSGVSGLNAEPPKANQTNGANGHSKTNGEEMDGCTSLGWTNSAGMSMIAQNWDWNVAQKGNFVLLCVKQPGTEYPELKTMTEGGMLAKVGFNDCGVGCLLNAIFCKGIDPTRMPLHLSLRTVLQSSSKEEAIKTLSKNGVACAGNIVIGDQKSVTSVECSKLGFEYIELEKTNDANKIVVHSNHYVGKHPKEVLEQEVPGKDTFDRIKRMKQLAIELEASNPKPVDAPDFKAVRNIFCDEQGFPCAINRLAQGPSVSETLFNIVMDLVHKKALVSVGRPSAPTEVVEVSI